MKNTNYSMKDFTEISKDIKAHRINSTEDLFNILADEANGFGLKDLMLIRDNNQTKVGVVGKGLVTVKNMLETVSQVKLLVSLSK